MGETKMNKQLGTKWFTFYTKIRPWLACLTSLTVIVDFFQYTDVYFSYWWLMLYLITGIVQPVLAVMVLTKSEGDYGDFVRFVKGVLIFETINIAYQAGVKQYITDFKLGMALLMTLIIFVIGYFLWYRLNIRYFENRILSEEPETVAYDINGTSRPPQTLNPNEVSKTYDNHDKYGNDVILKAEEKEETDNDVLIVSPKV